MNNLENLNFAALLLNGIAKEKKVRIEYYVENIYLDYGAGITGDTIVAYTPTGSFQIFSPRDLEFVKSGEFSLKSFVELFEKHMKFAS